MKRIDFQRILVANRGEIASRIIRAIQGLGKEALVIYADQDRDLPFVSESDQAWSLGSGDLSQTYLNGKEILRIAREARADAIHPGYGFLAENAEFARTCEESTLAFIGPSARVISLMGHKSNAREAASRLGVPVLQGWTGDLESLLEDTSGLTFPLLIKPSAGGGGKGMRIVRTPGEFEGLAREASGEALRYFGSGELYAESYLEGARHIEVQVISDHRDNHVHLFERECSLQRRYQKIIEEAPSVFISEETRNRITRAALELARGIGYTGAGTVEFLVGPGQEFYFMEMNTRIQVEHPVTELLTGVDLVREQITIAQGDPLSFTQPDITRQGHALEVRLYAEDPVNQFLPSTGTLDHFDVPEGRARRVDRGYRAGNRVEPWYDPLLAKLIVRGKDREDACREMIHALQETHISGLSTNRDFLVGLLGSGAFIDNRIHTAYLDRELQTVITSLQEKRGSKDLDELLAAAAFISLQQPAEGQPGIRPSPWQQIGHWRILPVIRLQLDEKVYPLAYRNGKGPGHMWIRHGEKEIEVRQEFRKEHLYGLRINRRLLRVWGVTDRSEVLLDVEGLRFTFRRTDIADPRYIPSEKRENQSATGEISAPLNGRVVRIHVKEGDRVVEGESMIVIESMKMENTILSDHEAVVKEVSVSAGQQVKTNQILVTLASI